MFKKAFPISIILIFSAFLQLYAQYLTPTTTKNKKAAVLYYQAQEKMVQGRFNEANAMLDEAIRKDKKFSEAYFMLATNFRKARDYAAARDLFQKIIDMKAPLEITAGANMNVGEISLLEGNYTDAQKYLQAYLDLKPRSKTNVATATRNIANCEFAREAIKNPLTFKATTMSPNVNLFPNQYFPSLTADRHTIVYTIIRTPNVMVDQEDLFISNFENGEWTKGVSISELINSKNNEGTASISGDGRVLVFTSCGRKDGFGSCDLYISKKEGGKWSKPVNMGSEVNTREWETQPSLTTDGRTLYFVSSRKGIYGQSDILYSTLIDSTDKWSRPVNLGKTINTTGYDVAPFIHPNGRTLYFASDARTGMGGYDMYMSTKEDTGWTEPKNLGYPLNTYNDEMSFVISADEQKGYYSVEIKKDANINSSIYEFDIPDQIKSAYKVMVAKGVVYDAQTKKKLGAKLELLDLKTRQLVQKVASDSIDGDYLVTLTEGSEYALYVSRPGYLFKSLSFNFLNKSSFDPLTLDVYLEPIRPGASVVLNNLFFESGKYELLPKSTTELDKIVRFMSENRTTRIEISGHTDDVGKPADNIVLSNNRAKAVVDYLTRNGVKQANVVYKGYGETKPFAPNTTDENRTLNRRIEFKVL